MLRKKLNNLKRKKLQKIQNQTQKMNSAVTFLTFSSKKTLKMNIQSDHARRIKCKLCDKNSKRIEI